MRLRLLTCAAAAALCASSAAAHHAISAYYDNTKRTTLEGNVSQFQFISPHPFVMIDVDPSTSLAPRQARGDPEQSRRVGAGGRWRLEMDNRSELTAIGVRSDTLRAGDRIVVSGSLARDRSQSLYVLRLTRPADGFTYEQVGGTPRLVSPGSSRR